MSGQELLRQIVLGTIADDYEDRGQVYQDVSGRAESCRIQVTTGSVERILLELVEQGLAKAYDVSAFDPVVELAVAPKLEEIADYYFWITPKGLSLFRASRDSDGWPFDDEGDLKPGWAPAPE